jgi:hypothetical protein
MPLKHNVIISQTGIFSVDLDPAISPFNVALQVIVLNPGNVTIINTAYSVEFTLDDLTGLDGTPNPNVRWTTDPQFPVTSKATITGNYFAPISAVRANVAGIDAGVTLELKIRQGDSIN